LISFGVGMLLPVLFWQMKLVTRIAEDGIYVRFTPFHLLCKNVQPII
jgi:hypothetical protein